MHRVKLIANHHAQYKRGDVFNVTQAELDSFGDKFQVLEGATPFDGLAISAGAMVLCERFEVDPYQVDGTGDGGQITNDDVTTYIALREVTVIKGDGKEVIRTLADGEVNATRGALDLARARGVNLNDVAGTGRDGKIIVKDVRAFLDEPAPAQTKVEEIEAMDAEIAEAMVD